MTKQVCKAGSKRSFIRSPNQNDMAFGYLCQGPADASSTLGLYRFEVKDNKEKKLKQIVLGEMWAINLAEKGLEGGVKSAILTRSMSQRLKFILATDAGKIAILSTKDGKVEN